MINKNLFGEVKADNTENQTRFNATQTAEKVGISIQTLKNWYRWENKAVEDGTIEVSELPKPTPDLHSSGRPNYWSLEQIEELKVFKSKIKRGQNGKYAKYTYQAYGKNYRKGKK